MISCIVFTDKYHLLESVETRGNEEIVIRVSDDAKEVTVDPAAKSAPPENLKETMMNGNQIVLKTYLFSSPFY